LKTIIGNIYNTVEKILYKIELKKVKKRNKLPLINIKSKERAIDLLLEEYLEKVLDRDIFSRSGGGFLDKQNENIFKDHLQDKIKKIDNEEEEYLIKILNKRISKWFVPLYLNEVDSFSERLMKELIEAGIKVVDPSYNKYFLYAAQKKYKSKTNDYLIERFKKSNLNVKRGIFRLFYWAPLDKESEEYTDRLSMLLNEYSKTSNRKLKNYISRKVPKEIGDYPQKIKIEAERYLRIKENTPSA